MLACLVPEQRKMVLHELFGEEGANFSATRTVIGSSDFTLKGHYSYDDIPGDDSLKYFSLSVHQDGWDKAVYPQVKDESFDMYQFIREVADIKASQSDPTWRLLGSPWTAEHCCLSIMMHSHATLPSTSRRTATQVSSFGL